MPGKPHRRTSENLSFKLDPRGDTPHAEASRAALLAYAKTLSKHDAETANRIMAWSVAESTNAVIDRRKAQAQ